MKRWPGWKDFAQSPAGARIISKIAPWMARAIPPPRITRGSEEKIAAVIHQAASGSQPGRSEKITSTSILRPPGGGRRAADPTLSAMMSHETRATLSNCSCNSAMNT